MKSSSIDLIFVLLYIIAVNVLSMYENICKYCELPNISVNM